MRAQCVAEPFVFGIKFTGLSTISVLKSHPDIRQGIRAITHNIIKSLISTASPQLRTSCQSHISRSLSLAFPPNLAVNVTVVLGIYHKNSSSTIRHSSVLDVCSPWYVGGE